jgi:hypothetical protein
VAGGDLGGDGADGGRIGDGGRGGHRKSPFGSRIVDDPSGHGGGMKIERVERFRTEDGKVHETLDEANEHVARTRWMQLCENEGIDEHAAIAIWDNRRVAAGLLTAKAARKDQ